MIKEIAFSIYAVTDIERSRKFYEGILGLVPNGEFDKVPDPKWIEYAVGSSTLAIGCSPDWKPSQDGAVIALEVEDFAGAIEKFKTHNLTFVLEPQDFPTCHMAVIEDPDKNRILIHKKK